MNAVDNKDIHWSLSEDHMIQSAPVSATIKSVMKE